MTHRDGEDRTRLATGRRIAGTVAGESKRKEMSVDYSIGRLIEAIDYALVDANSAAERIDRGTGGREVALAVTKLQEAKMWAELGLRLVMDAKEQ